MNGLKVYGLGIVMMITACKLSLRQSPYSNLVFIPPNSSREDIERLAANVIPSPRQLEWQRRELTAFFHFGINTFTDREWGDGTEDPKLFNPIRFDANQWINTLKDAGFKMVILTAKHHDGFCLWPSAFTDHSVKSSNWKNGQGDIVKELADACVKQHMDLGLYLSPWDRHEKTYGTDSYNQYYKNQLRELLTNYGPIAEVWFDGANGEGPNGKRQVYDFKGYCELIRELQPQATIAIMGPDVRWVGTESGYGRDSEWSPLPIHDTAGLKDINQMDNIIRPSINEMDQELGDINQLINANAIKWYPAEVDVSIRPGWFYHSKEDNSVKSPEKLLDIYFSSVGKNSSLLLNIPPNRDGLISDRDANVLKVFHYSLQQIFDQNLAKEAALDDAEFNFTHAPSNVLDNKPSTYWAPGENNQAPYLTFQWEKPIWFNILSVSEQIEYGQHIKNFKLEIFENDGWVTKVTGTTIGAKRLLRFPYIKTNKARLIFSDFRSTPHISEVGFYQDIPLVQIDPPGTTFSDSLRITMTTNNPEAVIHYTKSYAIPGTNTDVYDGSFLLNASMPINAVAILPNGQEGFVKDEVYAKAKYPVDLMTTPDAEYLHEGGILLCDGDKGDLNFHSPKWLGFKKDDLEFGYDLLQEKDIRNIVIHSLYNPSAGIGSPKSILVKGSHDGKSYTNFIHYYPEQMTGNEARLLHLISPGLSQRFRYLQFIIENGAGSDNSKPWMFVSEVEVL